MNDRAHALSGRESGNWHPYGAAFVVAAVYYAGSRIGHALVLEPFPLSLLWLPHALLLAALLLAPVRWWWVLILGVFPAHLLAEFHEEIPFGMVVFGFASNVMQALIGAGLLRWLVGSLSGLDTVRAVLIFSVTALLAALLSSYLDAGFVYFIDPESESFQTLWQARLFSNLLATMTIVPVALTWARAQPIDWHNVGRNRVLEAIALLVGLLGVSMVAFDSRSVNPDSAASLLYLPAPFLAWAALRFGPPLTSMSFAIVALLVILGAGHGRGPFLLAARQEDAFPIQLFLLTMGESLLLLAAVIEERRRAHGDLRASEDLRATAFRASPDAIAISRLRDGRILEANDRWLDLFGYGRDDLAGGHVSPLAEHLAEPDRAKLAASTHEGAEVHDLEVTLHDRGGSAHQAVVRTKSFELQEQPCTIVIVRDVTHQREAEQQAQEQRQQLVHLSRVASLTGLSGTLAHELNQPLTAILSNAQAALRFLARDPPDLMEIRSILSEIAEADKRAGLLIHHLRLLMKRGDEEFVRVDLNQLVTDVLNLLHSEFVTHGVVVRVSRAPDLPDVNGDRVQLQQLLLNLAANACEAMQGADRVDRLLTVTTVHAADGSVQIVVSDTGPGIAADWIEKVFEPYFTTKESGLGIGLPISRKIARAHGGDLVAEYRHGHGASMRLVLPVARSAHRRSA